MQIKKIHQMIDEAIKHEEQTGYLAALFRKAAIEQGRSMNDEEVVNSVETVKEYIQHVPNLLTSIQNAAKSSNIYVYIEPILDFAQEYFFNPYDIFPDHLGLFGLIDDAFITLSVIQAISENYQNLTGQPLIKENLSIVNQKMRYIIGEPSVSQLDNVIANALIGPNILQQIQQFTAYANSFTPFFDTSYSDMQSRIDTFIEANRPSLDWS